MLTESQRKRLGRRAALLPAVAVVLLGCVVLVGWAVESERLISLSARFSQMKANTAVGFVAIGCALLLLQLGRLRWLARLLAAAVVLLGLATLAEHGFGWELGIDELLFQDREGTVAMPSPGRMGANSALDLVLAGLSLLLLDVERRGVRPAQLGAGMVFVVALVALLGHAFDVSRLETGFVAETVTPMALHTALGFCVLGVGLLLARPNAGIMVVLRSKGAGGVLLRRLLLPALAVPILVGYLRLEGQRAGYYGTEAGLALYASILIVSFGGLVIATARELERLDVGRRGAELFQRSLYDASPMPILATSLDRTVLSWNRAAEELFGWRADEVIGRPSPLTRQEDDAALIQPIWRRLLAGEKGEAEVPVRRRDGTTLDVHVSIAVFRDGTGSPAGVVVIFQDLTERRRLELQLRHGQKMEAMGRLAGGVAHDFNNLLAVISGFAELALRRIKGGDGTGELGEIKNAAARAAELTRQLLAFSRKQVLDPATLDLNTVVAEMMPMLGRLIGEDIQIAVLTENDLPVVLADRGQVEQVLMNLVVNARDAMPDGGTLIIETRAAMLADPDSAGHAGAEAGRYACLSVTDTGLGIDPQLLEHIFEPFFTSKDVGMGTGLGLATVHGIVTQSGGYVDVSSELGLGTTLKLYFPATAASPEQSLSEVGERQARPGEVSETILLCEDSDGVRRLVEAVLREEGYTVLPTSAPQQAIELAGAYEGRIDGLITDVVLPQMAGPELATQLLQSQPGLRVLYISGYAAETLDRRGLTPGHAFLAKPFEGDALLQAIRRLLDTAPEREPGPPALDVVDRDDPAA